MLETISDQPTQIFWVRHSIQKMMETMEPSLYMALKNDTPVVKWSRLAGMQL